MPKFYVKSGQVNVIVESDIPINAARKMWKKVADLDMDMDVGGYVYVDQRGFREDDAASKYALNFVKQTYDI